jgi:hypothetical protein
MNDELKLKAVPTVKISEMTPAGNSAGTDLLEIARPDGGGGYDTFNVTGQNIYDTAFSTKTTTNLAEGSNLYYTDARARSALSGVYGIDYNPGDGKIALIELGQGQFIIGVNADEPIAGDLTSNDNSVDIDTSVAGVIDLSVTDSITLQNAYDNGDGTIQGNFNTKPLQFKNSGGTSLLDSNESGISIIGNASQNLLIANNLSDVADYKDTRGNIGLPTQILVANQDQDYTLSNPSPGIIYVNMPTAGHILKMPPIGVSGSLDPSTTLEIAASSTTEDLTIQDSAGTAIVIITPGDRYLAIPVGTSLAPPTGWQFNKITGTGTNPTMQDTYNAGSTIALNSDQPIVITAAGSAYGAQQDVIGEFPYNAVQPHATTDIYAISFTATKDGSITHLCYADILFSSGTRTVGIYQYLTDTTGTLLGQADVAKTDPLDSQTGLFRTTALLTPITVTTGVRYVIASVTPPSDPLVFFPTFSPPFGILDGVSDPLNVTVSGTLTYPQMYIYGNVGGTPTEWGGQNAIFQSILGADSTLSINDIDTSSAILDVESTTQSSKPVPSMTTAQMNAIPSPVEGSIVYIPLDKAYYFYDGTNWESLNVPFGPITPTAGNLLIGSGTEWVSNPITGDVTITSGGVTSIGATKVTNAMLAGSIDDSKLNTISTAGKVSNSATTATSANTASAIVARNGSGDFSAGTITADLTGNASTATALQNARTIGGVSFNGTANIVPQTIESASESSDTTCFPLFITASGTQQLQPKNNSNFGYNSSTNALTVGSEILNNSASALTGTNNLLNFPFSTVGPGNYINYGTIGNAGVGAGNVMFFARNLVFDSTTIEYKYASGTAAASLIEMSNSNISLKSCPTGAAGNTATPTIVLNTTSLGQLVFPNISANSALYLDASNIVTSAVLTNGQLLIGSSGAAPVAAAITAGAGITVTNGAGSITIDATGNVTYTEVTGTSQSMAVNNEYTANNAGLVTLTLPATAAIGEQVTVNGKGAGGWRIAQNSGQLIHLGSSVTTTGAGGSLSSTNQWDNIKLKCVTANTTWVAQTVVGNITIV